MADLTGHSLDRYRLLEKLGEGGMAVVYKAYDTRLETDVAVKVIRTENLAPSVYERSIKRFTREAKALARLTHPNIVKVTDYGEYDGKPYLVMVYLPGGTLKQKLGKPMPWQDAVKLILPIAEALEFAHSQNMIHRDVKPSNILITQNGKPMLSDFGIAKILDLEETADLTGTGMGIGTPEYMAPEQWTGKTSAQSDQYALGVVLYEMLTGRKPYTADTPAAILLMQSNEPLPRPSQYARDLPDKVEKLLLKMLAKDPADRYSNMGELAGAMESLLSSSPLHSGEGLGVRSVRRARERALETLTAVEEEAGDATVRETPSLPAGSTHAGSSWGKWIAWLGGALGLLLLLGLAGALIWDRLIPPKTAIPILTEAPNMTEVPAVQDEITDAKGVVMRLVPAGDFTMGSDEYDNEKPVHQVYVDVFYMDKYEVTNALYKACVDAGVCDPPHETSSYTHSSYYGNSQYDDYPVIYVDWNQANTYCEWRGARLPAEAEWEKAARGTDGRIYPWGDGSPNSNLLNYNQNVGDTTQVGSYPAGVSPYGIFDLAGNVWEWVADWYQAYPGNTISNDAYGTTYRVLRGGSWYSNDSVLRSASRLRGEDGTYSFIGFRCARSE